MASESTIEGRRLSPEFWAIVGTGITVVMGLIALAALILTVAGWHREDIRALGDEIRQLDAKVAGIDKRLAIVESRIRAAAAEPVEAEPSPALAVVIEADTTP